MVKLSVIDLIGLVDDIKLQLEDNIDNYDILITQDNDILRTYIFKK